QNAAVVRQMAQLQRDAALKVAASGIPVVIEGRQIGTEVLPDADLKIFLTADLMVRAKRRLHQYQIKNDGISLDEVAEQTHARDEQDTNREVGRLVSNPEEHGYFILNNSKMDEIETLSVII